MYQTLYNILRQERIEIPIIQRDYAQGREDKVYLRERMLGKMIKALRDEKGKENLSLDFVYGTNEYGAAGWPTASDNSMASSLVYCSKDRQTRICQRLA